MQTYTVKLSTRNAKLHTFMKGADLQQAEKEAKRLLSLHTQLGGSPVESAVIFNDKTGKERKRIRK